MTYTETIQYLYQQFPSFKKYGSKAVKYGLQNIQALCGFLGNPHQQFKSIHIAGTNGKGSVTHILAAVFRQAGFKTAMLTSPHYKDFRERLKINGTYIPEELVVHFVKTYQTEIDKLQASFFEITTAMAFWYFAQQKVDIAIIETGLGGRLDSTNIILPKLSIITNIGLDHQQMLGNSLAKIAYEKAGIIKKNTPVVIGERHPKTQAVFEKTAIQQQAPLYFSDEILEVSGAENVDVHFNKHHLTYVNPQKKMTIETDIKGNYQQHNLQTALSAIEIYQKYSGPVIENASLKQALHTIKTTTNLLGKWMILQQSPLVILDSAHNENGISSVSESIKKISYQKLHIVFGMMKDKTIEPILKLLPKQANYYFCSPNFKRALNVDDLIIKAQKQGLIGKAYPSVKAAYKTALQYAQANDLVLITGSCFVVAEVL